MAVKQHFIQFIKLLVNHEFVDMTFCIIFCLVFTFNLIMLFLMLCLFFSALFQKKSLCLACALIPVVFTTYYDYFKLNSNVYFKYIKVQANYIRVHLYWEKKILQKFTFFKYQIIHITQITSNHNNCEWFEWSHLIYNHSNWNCMWS